MPRYAGRTPELGRKLVGSCWAVQVSKGAGRQFAERLAIKFDRKSVVYPEISLLSPHHYDPCHAPWWSAQRRERRQRRTALRRTTELLVPLLLLELCAQIDNGFLIG